MENNTFTLTPNRLFKDRLFKMIFHEKNELLKLYNAINGTHYSNPDLLEINTLENAIYMTMANDISFIIDMRLALYEHQSTVNPNLPIRFLLYIADIYSSYTQNLNLYGSHPVVLPAPVFIIFYNGTEQQPDRKEYRLSDLFSKQVSNPALELKAIMLNINKGHNLHIMKACKSLQDYSEYVFRVRSYATELPLNEAVEKAITECIRDDILREFLIKNRAEAKAMSIYEYDEEKVMRMLREEAREDGYNSGYDSGYDSGFNSGYHNALKNVISNAIKAYQRSNTSPEDILSNLQTIFELSPEEAREYLENFKSEDLNK